MNNTPLTAPLLLRTMDNKKWYVRLAVMRGTHEIWETELVSPRYFTKKADCLRYIQQQMEQPNRVIGMNGTIINDKRTTQ